MRDYSNGKIYRLVHGTKTIYIGSSAMPLRKRMWWHRSSTRNGATSKIYEYIRSDEVGIENIRIVLIENWPCASKEELAQREQHWIEHCNFPNVELKNAHRAYRSLANKRLDNKINFRKYNQTDKGQAAVRRKRNPFSCVCGATGMFTNRFRHVQTTKHKDKIKRMAEVLVMALALSANYAAVQNTNAQNSGE